MVKHKNK